MVVRGHRESKEDEREDMRVVAASSGDSREKDSADGREERIVDERVEEDRWRRFRRQVTVDGGRDGWVLEESGREKEMKEWSDIWSGVTERLVVVQLLVKMRSRRLPALWVGGERVRVRSKEERRERKVDWVDSELRLKSPRRIRGVSLTGEELRRMSISSKKLPRGPGGR